MAKRSKTSKKSEPSPKQAATESGANTALLDPGDLELDGAEPANPGESADESTQAEPAAEAPADDVPLAKGFEVYDVDVDVVTLGPSRVPTDEMVADKVREIRAVGLIDPIVITEDYVCLAGNTRLLAYRQLKKKTIPARVAFNPKTGKNLVSTDKEAAGLMSFQSLTSNLGRVQPSPAEIAKVCEAILKDKTAESVKDIAARTGVSYKVLQRNVAVHTRGSKKLIAALASETISLNAAESLVANSKDVNQMDKTLDALVKAADGKAVTTDAVHKATSRRSGRHGKPGRKKTLLSLGEEALKTSETGVTGTLRRVDAGDYVVNIGIVVPAKCSTFAAFDLVREVQKQLNKLAKKDLQAELESARKSLEDQSS